MARSEGYARPARFAVRIFPPSGLLQQIKNQTNTQQVASTIEQARYSGSGQTAQYNAGVLNSLSKYIGRQINIHCDSVSMPGHDLQTQSVQYGSEPKRQMVTSTCL